MDYRTRRKKSGLIGTGYVEINPGKYSGKHWRNGNLFIREETLSLSTGIIVKHYIDGNRSWLNGKPKSIGMKITVEGRGVARRWINLIASQVHHALKLDILER